MAEWIRGHNEDDLPAVRQTPAAAWKWMIDEWSIQLELASARMRIPDGPFRQRLRSELAEARSLYAECGWLEDPAAYHRTPPPLDGGVQISATSAGDADFWHVRFASEFEPWPGEPGRDRWMSYRPVRTTHAWMLQHPDRPRPWVVAVNGYRTGEPETDMWMLYAHRLHRRWGLNVIAVVLPLHGPRAIGVSGSRVIHAGAMNTVFTVAQGAWDIRRVIGWVRHQQEAPAVAVSGISLGGYMAAMTAALEDDLAAVIAGVPESDLARGTRRQVEPLLPPFYEQWGLSWEPYEQILSVVSPLSLPCKVPQERRYIFAGLLDRWVRPGNVKALWEHWERPDMLWYQGSHLSYPFEREVARYVDRAAVETFGQQPPAPR
ncbi:alpha/beta hydrolase family protein [Candidatus Poriferisodalis sp.]|uniref:alpha/beta hydrolase family protein n=1 Tax=Candidatus Poriferisodalis sp. TaxID=3101277 RepID=UPI003B0123B0